MAKNAATANAISAITTTKVPTKTTITANLRNAVMAKNATLAKKKVAVMAKNAATANAISAITTTKVPTKTTITANLRNAVMAKNVTLAKKKVAVMAKNATTERNAILERKRTLEARKPTTMMTIWS